ncbi:ABC transporter ATP-binding protein [Salicibibacter cibarius]|nr:ABC transporter ATP-binding protein [Salicibibacter cibarius]
MNKTLPAIQINNVEKSFSKNKEKITVIDDFNLDVAEGQFVSFVGPSGCGKSTLLHIVGGFIPETNGEIQIRGNKVTKPGPDRGMMFQEEALFPWRNVYDNVAWGLEVQKKSKKERQEIVERFLKLVNLEDFKNSMPSELSGGMKQRISLARVLAFDPDVLLMDEPFGALDAQTRETMQVELQRIWSESQKSVLFVTHDIDEAVFLGDVVAVFSKRPAQIKELVKIDLDRPRDISIRKSPDFVEYRNYIWDLLHDYSPETNYSQLGRQISHAK